MKVLVIEDDAKISRAVARGLEAEGFNVDTADNGDDGLWMATEADYDLIVLDVMLPKRDGFAVCRDVRAAGRWTPILMLTARDDECSETRGLEIGADDYLTKPVSFPVLIARVRSLLRRSEHRETVPDTIGRIRLDPVSRRVWSSDVEVTLTHREFDVLEFLVRRHGRVVSKDAILRGVWEYDFDGSENIVQVYVTRLRRKLDGPHGTDHIRTVHGVGYCLEGNVA